MEQVLLNTDLKSLKLFKRGKVRDIYELGNTLVIVATDIGIDQFGKVVGTESAELTPLIELTLVPNLSCRALIDIEMQRERTRCMEPFDNIHFRVVSFAQSHE